MSPPVDTRSLSERDVCTQLITPAIVRAGWDLAAQVREEVTFTAGQVIVRGKLVHRGKTKRADYVLSYKHGLPLAVVEAKDREHAVGAGMQQAIEYAEMLAAPFALSSNGKGFVLHDRTGEGALVEQSLAMDAFPSPDELFRRYCAWKGIPAAGEAVVTRDYYSEPGGKPPRYYQVNAINAVTEAVARGDKRILLVCATGTGKTFTAFQIIWRLWKGGDRKRILFLADRDALITQTKNGDFSPFGNAMTRIENRTANKAFEIYLALYQAITGTEESKDVFRQFSPDFFDLIVVDECHRGSAAEDSAWRDVLEYFASATQVGLTATPKETSSISTTHYFGDPVYTYSLKQGIEDGFLAPYKVVRFDLDKDVLGWRPTAGQIDKYGQEIEDRVYGQGDFDRALVLEKRTELVARKVSQFLAATDRMAKTIVFCDDVDHANRMRQALVNDNADLVAKNARHVVQITGEQPQGKADLYDFCHPEKDVPVLATTSKLMTTGVDAPTCKVIVLDQTIKSMTEFKQIIGRGTRLREDYGKLYFTILDFKKATELFADPDFDGLPVRVYAPGSGDPPAPPDDGESEGEGDGPGEGEEPEGEGRVKYVVADVPVYVLQERVQYYGKDGKLVTESLRDYAKSAVREEFQSLDHFLRAWKEADRRQAIVRELEERGLLIEALADEVGRDFSAFDLVCHVAFGQPALTRRERANHVKKRDVFTRYGDKARAVLEALLAKYADEGVDDIEDVGVLRVEPLTRFGTPIEIVNAFGGRDAYVKAVRELEDALYLAS
jgi:type I restriction enzyme R subunit